MSGFGLHIMNRICPDNNFQTEIDNNIAQNNDLQGNNLNVNNAAEAAESTDAAQEQQNSNPTVDALSLFDSNSDAINWYNEYTKDFMPFFEEYAGSDYSGERYLIDCAYNARKTDHETHQDDIDELNEKYSVDEDSLMEYVLQRNDDLDEQVSDYTDEEVFFK